MKELEERILSEGRVLPGGVLKVDGFLNHMIDTTLLHDMAVEISRLFEGCGVNKILTVEASGIALAGMAGFVMRCPMVFAKKSRTSNISADVYTARVQSFTHGNTNTLMVSKSYLSDSDKVLIIDDFLATGAALIGLRDICCQAGAVFFLHWQVFGQLRQNTEEDRFCLWGSNWTTGLGNEYSY